MIPVTLLVYVHYKYLNLKDIMDNYLGNWSKIEFHTCITAPALFFDVSSCSSSHSDLLWRVWPPFITKIEEANTNNGLTLRANQPLIKGFSIKGGLIPKKYFQFGPFLKKCAKSLFPNFSIEVKSLGTEISYIFFEDRTKLKIPFGL